MIRGTTPVLTFDIGMDPHQFVALFVTFEQGNRPVLEKALGDSGLRLEEESVVLTLTQQETLKMRHNMPCEVQIRARDAAGNALASNIITVTVSEILKEGVI